MRNLSLLFANEQKNECDYRLFLHKYSYSQWKWVYREFGHFRCLTFYIYLDKEEGLNSLFYFVYKLRDYSDIYEPITLILFCSKEGTPVLVPFKLKGNPSLRGKEWVY